MLYICYNIIIIIFKEVAIQLFIIVEMAYPHCGDGWSSLLRWPINITEVACCFQRSGIAEVAVCHHAGGKLSLSFWSVEVD